MGLTVYGGGGKPEEEKTVTAGTSAIVVNPSSGKVMKKVTVNPTPTESKSVTPTTSELTVTPSEGKHLSQVVVGAVEDVTPEVTAQTPVITQIAENLGVTITTPSGTNKQILQGNNANLLNIKNNAKKEGAYVWKKLTAQAGNFVDFVVSDSETAYPDGGTQDGYWYEKVVEGVAGIDFGEVTVSSSINEITISHNLKTTPRKMFLVPKEKLTGNVAYYIFQSSTAFITTSYGDHYGIIDGNYGKTQLTSAKQAATYDASNITFKSSPPSFNGTYIWIAVA